MRSLIVEDEPTSAMVMQTFMATFGEAQISPNGREALERFEKALDDALPYDLVCLDILMPELDGKKVLARIREIETERQILGSKAVKIIMTTAVSQSHEIQSAFKHGCEAYLIKPIIKEKLISYLQRLELIPPPAES